MSWGDVTLLAFLAGSVVLVVGALAFALYLVFWCIDRLCDWLGMPFWMLVLLFCVVLVLFTASGIGMFSPIWS